MSETFLKEHQDDTFRSTQQKQQKYPQEEKQHGVADKNIQIKGIDYNITRLVPLVKRYLTNEDKGKTFFCIMGDKAV